MRVGSVLRFVFADVLSATSKNEPTDDAYDFTHSDA